MKKLTQSTILNLGSLATFIAFPLLYLATDHEAPLMVWGGFALMALSMIAPFVALKAPQK